MQKFVKIRLMRTWESCERTSYYVELTTDEGFTITPSCHRTGSVYTNHEGLTVDQARDRALIDAHEWSDLLRIPVDPYVEGDITFEPSMTMDTYTTRQELLKRREAEEDVAKETAPAVEVSTHHGAYSALRDADVFAQIAKLAHLDIDVDVSGGQCPVQVEGWFSHNAETHWFYFRARGQHWTLYVADKPGEVEHNIFIRRLYQPEDATAEELRFVAGYMTEARALELAAVGITEWREAHPAVL